MKTKNLPVQGMKTKWKPGQAYLAAAESLLKRYEQLTKAEPGTKAGREHNAKIGQDYLNSAKTFLKKAEEKGQDVSALRERLDFYRKDIS